MQRSRGEPRRDEEIICCALRFSACACPSALTWREMGSDNDRHSKETKTVWQSDSDRQRTGGHCEALLCTEKDTERLRFASERALKSNALEGKHMLKRNALRIRTLKGSALHGEAR